MKKEIRTFVALKIYPEKKIVEELNRFKLLFKNERINWVDEANFHLTLRFIGNTTREQLARLVDSFEKIAEFSGSFELSIRGVGYFKTKGQPQVLFIKTDASKELMELAKYLEESVVACGFQEELKPFRPHLTIGRIKSLERRTRFCSLVEELSDAEYQHVKVSEFILYQSLLKTEGPIYKIIRRFKLR